MTEYKVSIIVPVYNTEKYLRQCLDSLVWQTFPDAEIVCVNDGSTDGSLRILEEYREKYPEKLFVYSTENLGVSHARNFGFSKSRGEYVWFVDSDDYVEPDACEKLYTKAVCDGNDLVVFTYNNIDAQTGEATPFPIRHRKDAAGTSASKGSVSGKSASGGASSGKSAPGKVSRDAQSGVPQTAAGFSFRISDRPGELVNISPFPWLKFIRWDLFEGLAFPEGIRFEDLPVSILLAAKASSIGVVSECLYNYRKNAGFLNSLTLETLDIKKAVVYLNSSMKTLGYYKQYQNELDFIALRHFFYRFWKLLSNYESDKKDLKLRLINELYDYIDANIPNWRENPYVPDSLPEHIAKMLYFYGSREELLAFVRSCDGMSETSQKNWIRHYKKEKNLKLSVVIPVHNAGPYLRETLQSVLSQDFDGLEVICVDDASSDNSVEIVQDFQRKDPRVKLIRNERNVYAGECRNAGILAAMGEYVHFLDADDIVEPDGYQKYYRLAKAADADIVKGRSNCFDNDTGELSSTALLKLSKVPAHCFDRPLTVAEFPEAFSHISVVPWNAIYKRSFLFDNNVWFNRLICVNDRSFYNEATLLAGRIWLTKSRLVRYRINNSKSLVGNRARNFDCQFQSYELVKKQCERHGVTGRTLAVILDRELTDIFIWYRKYRDIPEIGESITAQTAAFAKSLDVSVFEDFTPSEKWYPDYELLRNK